MVDINGINKIIRSKWIHPNLLSGIRPQASSSIQNGHDELGEKTLQQLILTF